ncbi:MAG: hypothetical protein G01um101466_596 [Parcubacteria group bacterium Gr01-1014_66]|nr:MAG: hypothetical protein G01um101466_596 [Parcubacteria group bacterium Gr01-1014_66]
MKKYILIAVAVGSVVAGIGVWMKMLKKIDTEPISEITDFLSCEEAGYPIQENAPRVCRTPDGRVFVEEIGNALEKNDRIRLFAPKPNERITSPLVVRGEARGLWYFEASFPLTIRDEQGKELVRVPVQARGEWMTDQFVPFAATITFPLSRARRGTLILEKDNPSGLPAHADALVIPIRF